MKTTILTVILLINILLVDALGAQLQKVTRLDTKDLVQIYFTFDSLPVFKAISSNRRIDLIFSNSTLPPETTFFPTDEAIVKILPRPEKPDLIISLFFRYKPQNFTLTKTTDGKVVFQTLLSNEYSKTYEDLAKRLKGIGELNRLAADPANPLIRSPFRNDWMSFFSNFESPVPIAVPVKYTLPPFPIIRFLPPGLANNLQVLPAETLEPFTMKTRGQFGEMLTEKISQTEDQEARKLLALTLGEALLLQGDIEEAYKQLSDLRAQYKDEMLGAFADFLLIHLKAQYQAYDVADDAYQALESRLGKSNPLAPYLYLAQIESALASGQLKHLNELLNRDNIALPEDLQKIVQIHRADYWNAAKQPIKAYAAYQLLSDSNLLRTMPYSLNGYCSSLYEQKKYHDAVLCYEQLNTQVSEKSLQGIISFKKNLAKLKYEENQLIKNELAQIEKAYSGTEAGYRAGMKKADLEYIRNHDFARQAIEKYKEITENSAQRSIREEALFKQALIHSQLGESAQCVELLQQFLREFLTGDVRVSAQALLIDILPIEIKRLVDHQDFIKALVLAKKNKYFFQNNWINSKFLKDIAEAYHQVGLFDESQKLYLYLIEVTPFEQREELYLPMIQSTFDYGAYSLVEDYSSQYFYNYPQGKNSIEILIMRLQALIADQRLAEALKLLPAPLPENIALYSVASSLYYRTDDYGNCLNILKKLALLETPLPARERFLMAECLFQTGCFRRFRTTIQNNNRRKSFLRAGSFSPCLSGTKKRK